MIDIKDMAALNKEAKTKPNHIGSPWRNDGIAELLAHLTDGEYCLDPTFEEYGAGFCSPCEEEPHKTDYFGNFYDLSFGFSITTDNADLIAALDAAISQNKATPEYKRCLMLSTASRKKKKKLGSTLSVKTV